MKRNLKIMLFLASLLIVFVSCTTPYVNPPSSYDDNKPTANFSFEVEQPLKVVLTNRSFDAKSYKWDFGDGKTSTEENPIHRYSKKGVYKITLTAKNGSKTDVFNSTVTIEEPTRCYLAGYKVSKIPIQNEYYQIRFTDQYTFSADIFGTTAWTLLSDANLPKVFTFSSPKQVTGFTKYWCTLWKSSKKDGPNEAKVMRCSITKEQLFTDFPETLTNSDKTSAIVEMHFTWK